MFLLCLDIHIVKCCVPSFPHDSAGSQKNSWMSIIYGQTADPWTLSPQIILHQIGQPWNVHPPFWKLHRLAPNKSNHMGLKRFCGVRPCPCVHTNPVYTPSYATCLCWIQLLFQTYLFLCVHNTGLSSGSPCACGIIHKAVTLAYASIKHHLQPARARMERIGGEQDRW